MRSNAQTEECLSAMLDHFGNELHPVQQLRLVQLRTYFLASEEDKTPMPLTSTDDQVLPGPVGVLADTWWQESGAGCVN